jgi:hypothetical protein
MYNFNWSFICYICKENGYVLYLRTCGSLNSANRKKYWVRKSQIRGSHLLAEGPQI